MVQKIDNLDQALKNAEAINIVYELITEPKYFTDFAARIVDINKGDPQLRGIERALKNSAQIASNMAETPDVDLSRDIGVIVVGLNRDNRVSHTPPGLSHWLGAKYVGDNKGIGWIESDELDRNVAHILNIDSHDPLPVHAELSQAYKNGELSRLVVVHEFILSKTALDAFKQLYRLTDAETRLCELLSKGFTLGECAEITKVKKSTTRSHLKNVFSKIGVNNQSSLIRILTQVSAASAIQDFSHRNNISLEPDWRNGLISQQTLTCRTRFGTQLTYSVYGDPKGKPVLFFHCGFGARHHSRSMAEAAKSAGVLIYKPDRPGFGHSELLPNMNIRSIAKATEDLLDHLSLKTVDAIGFGVGGRTLLDCLNFLPGRVKTANLYSFRGQINGYNGSLMKRLSYLIWERPGILMNFIKILRLHSARGIAGNHLKEYFRDSAADRSYLDDPDTLTQMLTEMHLSTRQDFKGSYHEHHNLKSDLPDFNQPAYDIPIRFIYGKDDPFNSLADNLELIDAIPKAQKVEMDNWGQLHITHKLGEFLDVATLNQKRPSSSADP